MIAQAAAALSEGNALRAAGRLPEAADAYRRAIALAPQQGAGYYNLGIALRQASELRAAALAFREAARRDPADFDAVQNAVDTVASAVRAGDPPLFARAAPPADVDLEGISIVVCSVDDARLAATRANFGAALEGVAHELVAIRDARSLAEGYNRGLAAARYPIAVLAHDDVELLSPRPFHAIARALRDHDLVGLAGSRRVTGPAVAWSGHPHLHGWIAYPAAQGWDATVFSLQAGIVGGMQALDGMLIAGRRDAMRAVGFDAHTFDGFHFYDLDFCHRAHLAGLRLAVTTDVSAVHASEGRFDDDWRRYAERFRAKFPALAAPAGAHHSYGVRLDSREQVLRHYEELRGLAAAA